MIIIIIGFNVMFILFLQVKLGIFVRYGKLEKSYRNMIIISYNKDFSREFTRVLYYKSGQIYLDILIILSSIDVIREICISLISFAIRDRIILNVINKWIIFRIDVLLWKKKKKKYSRYKNKKLDRSNKFSFKISFPIKFLSS